jgi:hypothetical protein
LPVCSGFGVVVRDGQTPVNLANLIISGNFFDGGLAVVNAISANNSVVSFDSNTLNDVAFDTLTGGAKADAFVFAKLGAADTITDYSGTGRQGDRMIRSGSMMPSSPASPLIRPSPFFSSHSPPAISARPSTPASASSTTAIPSGTTLMAWSAAR